MKGRHVFRALLAVGCLSASQLFAGGLPGTVIGSSGSYGNSGNTINKVFDGSLNTYYDAAHASGDWAGLDFGFGNAKVITGIRYGPRSGFANRMVGGQFQGANVANFSSGVVTLYTITSQPPEGTFTAQALTNTTAFRYVRYVGPAGGYCDVAEVEFYDAATWPVVLFSDFPVPWGYAIWANAGTSNVNESYNNALRWAWPGGFLMSQRQSGVFRQTPYTEAAATAAGGAYDYLTQLNSTNLPNTLLLSTDPADGRGFTWVSPNQDFSAFSAQGVKVTDIQVQIDPLGPGSASSSGHWAGLVFGTAPGASVQTAGTGMLIRNGGAYQVFDNGNNVFSGNAGALSGQFYTIEFQINSTSGAYTLLINGNTVYSGTHAGGFATNNFLTLESYNVASDTGIQNDYFQSLQVLGPQPVAAASTSYYLSPTGNDTNSGTSSSYPWRTLARANVEQFQPGDQILLQGGQTFSGCLNINNSGVSGAPLSISSYGTGNATINGGSISAISVLDAHDVTISNLTLVGNGYASNQGDGITIINNTGATPQAASLANFNISSVDAGNFGGKGISFLGSINNVSVTQSSLHDNGEGGLWVQGGGNNPNYSGCANCVVDHVNASHNPGTVGDGWSGYGIAVSSTTGVVINRCTAGNNGWLVGMGGAMSGIQLTYCDHVVIQYCESYKSFAGLGDGEGICFEQVSTGVIQYNYTHDNDGAGFMILGDGSTNDYNDIIRYNISQNDAQKGGYTYGGIFVGAGFTKNVDVYNNTVYISPSTRDPGNTQPIGIRLLSLTGTGNSIRNNIIVTTGGRPAIDFNGGSDVTTNDLFIQGNDYWVNDPNNMFNMQWAPYTFARFQAATGQELLNGTSSALLVNPGLNNAGGGATIGNADQLTTLAAYQLQPSSPVRSAGLDLSQFGTVWDPYNFATNAFLGKYFSTNRVDFYGNPLPAAGSGLFSIGAHQVNPAALPAPTGLTANTGSWGVALSWNASVGALNYDVWRAKVSGGPYLFIATVNGTTYTDISTTNGATYYYVVTAQNAVDYSANSAEVSVVGVTPTILTHRYSFNEAAGSTNIIDSVGGQNGKFYGTGGGPNGAGNLVLNGTNSYVDLGPNLIAGYSSFSVEAWVNVPTANNWDRLFDFGNTDGGGNGSHSVDLAVRNNGDVIQFEIGDGDPSYTGNFGSVAGPRITGAGWIHVVVVYDPALALAKLYTNGVLVASGLTGSSAIVYVPLSSVQDVFSYIGKSTYGGSTLHGTVAEFRVYQGDLTAQQVAANYQAGANALPTVVPVLYPIASQTIVAGQNLSITNVATDANVLPQTLTYSLPVAPVGAAINATTGLLTWRPAIAQSPSTNAFAVVVNDNGVPSLSATQSFVVTVLRPATPVLGSLVLSNGVFSLGVSGSSGPDYVLLGATNLTPPITWKPISTNAAATVPFSFTIPTTNQGANFYRLQLAP